MMARLRMLDGGAMGSALDLQRKISRRLARYLPTKPFLMRNARPLVSFTFDDIPESAGTHGAAVLESHGLRGTFYIAGGLCGGRENGQLIVSAERALELHRDGHEIGCHTFHHSNVQLLGPRALQDEIARNRAFFRALSDEIALDNFAYPFGIPSLERKVQLQRVFASCRGIFPGVNRGLADLAHLRAVEVYDRTIDWPSIEGLLELTTRSNGWLIFYTHDVEEDPSWIGCSPRLLGLVAERAIASGCEVVTIRDGMRRIGYAA